MFQDQKKLLHKLMLQKKKKRLRLMQVPRSRLLNSLLLPRLRRQQLKEELMLEQLLKLMEKLKLLLLNNLLIK